MNRKLFDRKCVLQAELRGSAGGPPGGGAVDGARQEVHAAAVNHLHREALNLSINQSVNQSINQSVNQSIHSSINQLIQESYHNGEIICTALKRDIQQNVKWRMIPMVASLYLT